MTALYQVKSAKILTNISPVKQLLEQCIVYICMLVIICFECLIEVLLFQEGEIYELIQNTFLGEPLLEALVGSFGLRKTVFS